MVKSLKNIDVVEFASYIVTLEKIKNTTSGAPRYKATIINIEPERGMNRSAYVYQFTGHYCGERKEAEFILQYHLDKEGRL